MAREEGFSLAELLVGILIVSMLIFAIFAVLDSNLKSARAFKAKSELGQDLRKNLAHISDQMRVANEVVAAEPEEMSFRGYVTGTDTLYDVSIFKEGEEIRYTSSPALLGEGEKALASGVVSLHFSYYDKQENETTDLDAISMVQIDLRLRRGSAGTAMEESAVTRVNLRR